MGDGLWSEAELLTRMADFANLDITQIDFFGSFLIEMGPQCQCQQDRRPVLYLVCWMHAVHMRQLEVLRVSP
jgi:hypothetical protein